jgi:hypothetical protein
MSTRKRKQDEELLALPSDESEEEEEYVLHPFPSPDPHGASRWASIGISAASLDVIALQCATLVLLQLSLRLAWSHSSYGRDEAIPNLGASADYHGSTDTRTLMMPKMRLMTMRRMRKKTMRTLRRRMLKVWPYFLCGIYFHPLFRMSYMMDLESMH